MYRIFWIIPKNFVKSVLTPHRLEPPIHLLDQMSVYILVFVTYIEYKQLSICWLQENFGQRVSFPCEHKKKRQIFDTNIVGDRRNCKSFFNISKCLRYEFDLLFKYIIDWPGRISPLYIILRLVRKIMMILVDWEWI